jgi:hypothetical protein
MWLAEIGNVRPSEIIRYSAMPSAFFEKKLNIVAPLPQYPDFSS